MSTSTSRSQGRGNNPIVERLEGEQSSEDSFAQAVLVESTMNPARGKPYVCAPSILALPAFPAAGSSRSTISDNEARTCAGHVSGYKALSKQHVVLSGCYNSIRLPSLGEGAGQYSFE